MSVCDYKYHCEESLLVVVRMFCDIFLLELNSPTASSMSLASSGESLKRSLYGYSPLSFVWAVIQEVAMNFMTIKRTGDLGLCKSQICSTCSSVRAAGLLLSIVLTSIAMHSSMSQSTTNMNCTNSIS